MHADELDIGPDLVQRLVCRQFPHWSDLPVSRIDSAGVDNAMFRLGETFSVRLPRRLSSVGALRKEQEWLPQLAQHLPLAAPTLVGAGPPSEDFPWPWSVNVWIEGEPVLEDGVADWRALAHELAKFMSVLHNLDPSQGPQPGEHNFGRGVPLAARDHATRRAIREVAGLIDEASSLAAWEADSAAYAWMGAALDSRRSARSKSVAARGTTACGHRFRLPWRRRSSL